MSSKKKSKRKNTVQHNLASNQISFKPEIEMQQGIRYHQSGKLQEAAQIYNKIIQTNPYHSDAIHLLGVVANQTGEYATAETLITRAIQITPDSSLYYYNLAKTLKAQGKTEKAISCYQKAVDFNPDDSEAYLALGNSYQLLKQTDEALICFQKAIQIKPDYAEAYNNIGTILKDQGKFDKALSYYYKALEYKPTDYEVLNNLGIALKSQGKLRDAISCYEKAIVLKPDYAEVYNNIGIAFKDEGRLSDAIECYKKTILLKPELFEAYNNMGVALKDQGRIEEAITYYHDALKLKPDYVSAHSNLLYGLHHLETIDPVQLFEQHKLWADIHAASFSNKMPSYDNSKREAHRLRIGYVSPDFRTHSVAYFMESILKTHDRKNFEIFCYSDVAIRDETTTFFKHLADYWRDISGIPDEDAVEYIIKDQIDILVDLAGHTARNRMLLFARKPAPLQITYLGYPNTTGLKTIDYRLTDYLADPPHKTDHLYTEKLIRMPHSFLCYTPYKKSPAVSNLPAEQAGFITFGSFNNRAKITPCVVKTWAQILKTVSNSRLYLKSKSFSDGITQEMLRDMFVNNGVLPERIKFLTHTPTTYSHLESYNSIDIGLDTFPYNGTTTTCEALWMGVPVIVLSGDFHVSRVGVSLLTNVGLKELISNSLNDYTKIAVDLAENKQRLKQIRAGLRSKMTQSSLMDTKLFIKSLENIYQTIWKHHGKEDH